MEDLTGNILIDLDDAIRLRTDAKDEIDLGSQIEDPEKYVSLNLSGYSELVDVTVPVQSLVESGRLTFFEGSKSDLAGFYDPCALLHDEQKHLLLRYSYQNTIHQVLLSDEEGLKIRYL